MKFIHKFFKSDLKNLGGNKIQLIPKFFYFNSVNEKEMNLENNIDSINKIYDNLNPKRYFNCFCLKIKDFFVIEVIY